MILVLALISFVARLTDMMKRNIPLHPLLLHLWPWRQLSRAALLSALLHTQCLWQAEDETPPNNLLSSKTTCRKWVGLNKSGWCFCKQCLTWTGVAHRHNSAWLSRVSEDTSGLYTQKLIRWKLESLEYYCYSMNALTLTLDASSFNHSFPIHVELHFNPNNFALPSYRWFAFSCIFFSPLFFFLLKSYCFINVRTTFNLIPFFWHFFIIGLWINVCIRAVALGTCVECRGGTNKPKPWKDVHQTKLAERLLGAADDMNSTLK